MKSMQAHMHIQAMRMIEEQLHSMFDEIEKYLKHKMIRVRRIDDYDENMEPIYESVDLYVDRLSFWEMDLCIVCIDKDKETYYIRNTDIIEVLE